MRSPRARAATFAELDARGVDIAIVPHDEVPARFVKRLLHEEDFMVALRRGHPHADRLTLDRYCALDHLVVSVTGDPYGFVDRRLAASGRARRTALTVPNFLFALAVLADSDLVAALPRRFVALHAGRFAVVARELPLASARFRVNAVMPGIAALDDGLAWLLDRLADRSTSRPLRRRRGLRRTASPTMRRPAARRPTGRRSAARRCRRRRTAPARRRRPRR